MVGKVGVGAIYQNQNAMLSDRKAENQNLNQSKEVSRAQRVDEIRDSIKSGNYKIDLDKTSEKMALYLLS